jgi:hypothetical protein
VTATLIDTGIDTPGVYTMTADEYHADPVAGGSLSSTGARRLLPPSCPAKFRWEQDHGAPPKRHFDLGHAAHQLVLGDAGAEIVVIDADSYRTKAAQADRDDAYEAGAIPLLPAEHDQVKAMAASVLAHPIASRLFNPQRGRPEVALIWRDHSTGIWRRARFDWLPDAGPGRLIIPDLKTCASADPDALSKAVAQHGYHQQSAWYRDGAIALGLGGEDTAFVFVCVEKTPPYVVTVIELDHVAMRIGAARNRRALSIYEHCSTTGHWPPYSEDIEQISLPVWAEIAEGEHLT